MTYKLPEPVAWRFFYGTHGWPTFNSAEYVREYMPGQIIGDGLFTVDQMQAAYAAGLAARVPEGWKLVPVEPTQPMISAMMTSQAQDSEGQFLMLMDILDYSGENKSHTVLKAAYAAMLTAVSEPKP